MIPALARWNGDHAMTKDTTKEAAVAAEALLFEDWFDGIEDGVPELLSSRAKPRISNGPLTNTETTDLP